MCLGTVILPETADAPATELADVVSLSFEDGFARIRTLFDETHDIPGVSIRRIDMGRGLKIFLARETAA